MKLNRTFTAYDGTTFETADNCRDYEQTTMIIKCLACLSEDDIAAALSRNDTVLGDILERAGSLIAARRRKEGNLKRTTVRE